MCDFLQKYGQLLKKSTFALKYLLNVFFSGDSGDSGLSLEGSNHELNRMNRVVSEIVETERIYVKDLGDIVQVTLAVTGEKRKRKEFDD